MGNIGFDINNEFLPSFDRFQNEVNQRLMFLKLFNQENCCDIRFSKEELTECKTSSLFKIFAKKITKNLQFDGYIKTFIKEVDVEKTNTINRFFEKTSLQKRKFSLKNSFEESNVDVALKLIKVFDESNYSIFLDGEKIFKNFVTNKIIRGAADKEVYVNVDSIDIKTNNDFSNTKIFTYWQFLDSNNLKVEEHIKQAVNCIETTEFKQVYLVYPKNEKFNKHIKIECENELSSKEYEIKLIPYSLRSTLR